MFPFPDSLVTEMNCCGNGNMFPFPDFLVTEMNFCGNGNTFPFPIFMETETCFLWKRKHVSVFAMETCFGFHFVI